MGGYTGFYYDLLIYNDNPRKKSLERQSKEKKGRMVAMFDYIRTEMDL